MGNYICPVCGQPLEAVGYVRKGQSKTKLRCSDPIARLNEDHRYVVYYSSRNGRFWSFGLQSPPIAAEPDSGPQRAAKPEPDKPPRRYRRASNRQRQLSL